MESDDLQCICCVAWMNCEDGRKDHKCEKFKTYEQFMEENEELRKTVKKITKALISLANNCETFSTFPNKFHCSNPLYPEYNCDSYKACDLADKVLKELNINERSK